MNASGHGPEAVARAFTQATPSTSSATFTFASSSVTDAEGTKGKVRGTLTMQDVSKEVVLDTELLGTRARGRQCITGSEDGMIRSAT